MAEKAKQTNPAVIQAVKAVAVLVIICLVCGALLALCNDLLYVDEDTKLARAMQKIYADYGTGDKEFNEANKSFSAVKNDYGTVTDVKKAQDGAYVISAKGGGGYKGTVTVYVVVKQQVTNGKTDAFVMAWTIKEHDGETFLGNITSKQQSSWYVNKSITEFNSASFALANNKVSGTTLSSTAINNAVKSACQYSIDVLKLVSTPESEARDAVLALLGATGEGYTFSSVADSEAFAEFAVGEQALSFYFEGSKANADSLEAYVYGEGSDRQIVVVKSGLTHEERLAQDVVAASDNASADVIAKVKGLSYFESLVHKSYAEFAFAGEETVGATHGNGIVNKVYKSTDGAIVVEAKGNGGFEGGTITINVIISGGTIKGWWIVSHENQSFLAGNILSKWDTVKEWFVGQSIDTVLPTVTPDNGEGKGTGATWSENAIINAINTACEYAGSLAE